MVDLPPSWGGGSGQSLGIIPGKAVLFRLIRKSESLPVTMEAIFSLLPVIRAYHWSSLCHYLRLGMKTLRQRKTFMLRGDA